ncbi:hypothetical protein N481_16355 [Pseudoalteromonas luteoviolacea S4047-1]|nr:hypothetical protein N481_16355 [Pseudoalteromonas luteoviolacea S4047-1]
MLAKVNEEKNAKQAFCDPKLNRLLTASIPPIE